jgi:hypothetical protein
MLKTKLKSTFGLEISFPNCRFFFWYKTPTNYVKNAITTSLYKQTKTKNQNIYVQYST